MRRLQLLKSLLRLPTVLVIFIVALLGNLDSITTLLPQTRNFVEGLARSEWIAAVHAWLSQSGLPNWALVVLLVLLVAVFDGAYRLLSPEYWLKRTVVLSTKVETKHVPDGVVIMASLVARNQENQAITDCFATLEAATNLYGMQLTPLTKIRNSRLRWKEGQPSSEACMTTLPARSVSRICVADTADGFQFSACKPSATYDRGRLGLYLVKIKVDGKLRGNSIEPQLFEGYLYVEDAKKGKPPKIIFERGDWKKDKRLPKPYLQSEGKKKPSQHKSS